MLGGRICNKTLHLLSHIPGVTNSILMCNTSCCAFTQDRQPVQNCVCRKLPGGFSLVSMPWLSNDQGWSILSRLSVTQMESDSVWPAIQEMLGRAHAPYPQ